MNKISAWLYNFMRGRYGFDQLGQAMSIAVVVIWIISIICGVFANLFGIWAARISSILNWIGLILLAIIMFRALSRNISKRQAENQAFLDRRRRKSERKNSSQKDISSKKDKGSEQGYKYLNCAFCGQQMRVPKGKGKIAVKCPACGEKTIIKS